MTNNSIRTFIEEYMELSKIIFKDVEDDMEKVDIQMYQSLAYVPVDDDNKRKNTELYFKKLKLSKFQEHYQKNIQVFDIAAKKLKQLLNWRKKEALYCQLTLGKNPNKLDIWEVYANHIVGKDVLNNLKISDELKNGIKRR